MQKKIYLLFILLTSSNLSLGQKLNSSAAWISFYAGDLAVLSENFTDYYDSKNELTYGIGLGVPLSRSLVFDASVSYFQKSSNYLSFVDQTSIESTILKQVIFNAGLQVQLLPNRIVGLSFLVGVNYAIVDEKRKSAEGAFVYQLEGEGNFGIYGGANLELSLGRGPFAIFADAKYTYSWNPILEFDASYRELKYSAGIKLYLSSRWK